MTIDERVIAEIVARQRARPMARSCPGCGSLEAPIPSCLSPKVIKEIGSLPLHCPRCARHVFPDDRWIYPLPVPGKASGRTG